MTGAPGFWTAALMIGALLSIGVTWALLTIIDRTDAERALRRRIQEIADQTRRDRTCGDWPAVPRDFEVSHRSDDGR